VGLRPMAGSPSEGAATHPYKTEDEVSATAADTPIRQPGGDIVEVPLSEEEVKVGKRTVGAGEVKLHKTVTTEQVNVPVELKREDIVVERVGPHEVASSGTEAYREEQINIPLSREEPVVEKETRVTGGVRVRKTRAVEQETIRENVRRENVDLDESGKTNRAERDAGGE
jgi:uncharacterized protein (TIGR02271 family)